MICGLNENLSNQCSIFTISMVFESLIKDIAIGFCLFPYFIKVGFGQITG